MEYEEIEERARKAVPDMLRINDNYVASFVSGYYQGAIEEREQMVKDKEALRKRVADTLFMLTKTEEVSVERVLEVAEQLTKGILS